MIPASRLNDAKARQASRARGWQSGVLLEVFIRPSYGILGYVRKHKV